MSRRQQRGQRGQRGSIMVQALIVLAGLVALMAVIAANQHAALEATQDRMRERRADLAARSAVARALAVLQQANTNTVTLNDDWAQLGDTGNMVYDMGDGTTTFRLQIVDAAGLINVNSVTQAQLALLPLTPEQQDSLLDWRASGEQPRANGAKDDYYNGLQTPALQPPQPYNAKLGRLNSINDLTLIRGWTAQTLLYPQTDTVSTGVTLQDSAGNNLPLIAVLTADSGIPNRQASGAARIDLARGRPNAATFERFGIPANEAAQLAARGPYTSFASLLRQPGITTAIAQQMLNQVSFSTATRLEGKINLNTATLPVLEAVPNITPDIANAIVQQQQATGFTNLGNLTSIPGLNGTRLAGVADYFGVGSDTWIVRAYGESGGVGVAMEVVVGVRNGQARPVTWNRLPNTRVPAWWSWSDTPTETAQAGDSSQTTSGSSGSGIGGGSTSGGNR